MFKRKYYLPRDVALAHENARETIKSFTYDSDVDTYANAILLPLRQILSYSSPVYEGGVCDSKYNLLAGYVTRTDDHNPVNLEIIRTYKPRETDKSNETVIFGGCLYSHFGDFLTESLVRLWYLVNHSEENHKVAFLPRPKCETLLPYQQKILELIGIGQERILIIEKPTQFKNVIVPKQAWYIASSYNTQLFNLVFDKIREAVHAKPFKKIYLSRSKLTKGQKILNESYFENFFAGQGYTVVYPEQLPVEEQIAYMAGAEELACTFGTLSHHAIFSKPGIKVISLYRASSSLGFISRRQMVFEAARNIDFVYIDVSLSFMPHMHTTPTLLIGPTGQWNSFLNNELGITITKDIFEYLNTINVGDYLRTYLKTTVHNQRAYELLFGGGFNHVKYLKCLYNTFDPDDRKNLLKVMLKANPAFSNRIFKLRSNQKTNVIRLNSDCSITNKKSDVAATVFSYWSFWNSRLYLIDSNANIKLVFEVIRSKRNLALGGGKIYMGRSLDDLFTSFKLIELRHPVIRFLIKILVDKSNYKKYKKNPTLFFADSESKIIRFLGKRHF